MKKNKLFFAFAAGLLLTFSNCETLDLDQTESPNAPTIDQLDPEFVFNSVQIQFAGFIGTTNGFTQDMVRQTAMTGGGNYTSAYEPVNFNGIWSSAYGILRNVKAMEPKAEETNLTYHLGASKVLKAYTMITLVDVFGDVPYTEALLGSENLNPKFDSSADVYKAALTEIDEALEILSLSPAKYPRNDLYYGTVDGSNVDTKSKWITLAKTLKLKALNTARLNGTALGLNISNEINSLITENDLIDTIAEDFNFRYSSNRLNPDSRHPDYALCYENNAQIGGFYLGNYFMWTMVTEKGITDPRAPYFIYRQAATSTTADIFTLGCNFQPRPAHFNSSTYASFYNSATLAPFCVARTNGYWGRDHGDNGGIPPDNRRRAVYGSYPVGGKFDAGEGTHVQNNGEDGARGAGVLPILLSSYVYFMKAEAILTAGVTGDARVELENAIRASFAKTSGFGGSPIIASSAIDNYVDIVMSGGSLNPTRGYDDVDNTGKLEIIMKEFYIAAWGNGIEPFNNYRRTGYPSNMQPTLLPASGDYFYSAFYPVNSISTNTNAPTSNLRTRKSFWQPEGLNLH